MDLRYRRACRDLLGKVTICEGFADSGYVLDLRSERNSGNGRDNGRCAIKNRTMEGNRGTEGMVDSTSRNK